MRKWEEVQEMLRFIAAFLLLAFSASAAVLPEKFGAYTRGVEAGKELWELSRLAAEDEGVRTAVTSGNLDALEGSPFKEALERYLDSMEQVIASARKR